jgi:hypothetical protein
LCYFQGKGSAKLSAVREQMLLPCAVRSITPEQVSLQLPLSGCNVADVELKVSDLTLVLALVLAGELPISAMTES